MPEPDPFNDNPKANPYQVLGISPSASFDDARRAARKLQNRLTTQAKQHKGDDEQERQRYLDAAKNVKKALQAIDDPSSTQQPQTTGLELELLDDRIVVGEPARFAVRDENGDRVTAAKLEHDGRTERTDSNAETELTFRNTGNVTVTATVSGGNYTDATETYAVVEVVQLDVAPVDDVTVGPTEFRVTGESGSSVDGATVSIPDGDSAKTTGGTATLDVEPDDDTVTATKSDEQHTEYLDATRSISVGKREVQLDLELASDSPVLGEPVEIVVREADTGDPVEDAQVEVKEASKADTTGPDGRVTFEFDRQSPTIGANKSDTSRVSYKVGTLSPTFSKQQGGINLEAPDTVTVGETATVTVTDGSHDRLPGATVEAVGAPISTTQTDADGEATIQFSVDPETTVRLRASKEADTVDHGADTHEVTVEERERSLTITEYPQQPTVGQPAVFVVEDETGSPVQATLKGVPEGGTATTDPSNGRAELTFENPVPSTVTAYTDDGEFDEYSVTVTPVP